MKKILALLLLPVSVGCMSLTATVPQTAEWTIPSAIPEMTESASKFGVTRLSQVEVRAPYDVRQLAIARADGSLAFDAYNRYAALPSQLLKGAAFDGLSASGIFKRVVPATSAAAATHLVELTVSEIKFDCSNRAEDPAQIDAIVSLSLIVLDAKREIVGTSRGSGTVDARDGNYGEALSRAFARALTRALEAL